MPRELADLYDRYKSAIAFVDVEDIATGDRGIGSAFHIGDGVFVTARHVLDGKRVLALGTTFRETVPDANGMIHIVGQEGSFRHTEPLFIDSPRVVMLPNDDDADVAALAVDLHDVLSALPLGGHLDDWMTEDDMVLDRVLLMGYPPIPFVTTPRLLAVSCEVNALVDRHDVKHPHFIISSLARGGFSGAPVIHEGNFALGLVTASLTTSGKPEELGFMTVLTVEPIFRLLSSHGLLPAAQLIGDV